MTLLSLDDIHLRLDADAEFFFHALLNLIHKVEDFFWFSSAVMYQDESLLVPDTDMILTITFPTGFFDEPIRESEDRIGYKACFNRQS